MNGIPYCWALERSIKGHFISIDRQYKYINNDRLRIRVVCKGEGCKWLMLVDVDWIAEEFLEKFRANLAMSFGDFKKENPKACKSGFKFCMPIIRLDGCFLKEYCRGMLLVAIGIDGNNNMFPLAYAIVEKENTNSWTWFVQLLKEDLDVQDTRFFTFISDRQKGLKMSLGTVYEGAEKPLLPLDKAGEHEEKEKSKPVSYSYSFFHLIFSLASMYSAMLLTGWSTSVGASGKLVDVGWPSVWIRIITGWSYVN
uniref:MULE transposase domain-containing protein n=1 Tax=Cannabis sativa TaxID=3483 RepID=A0A803QN15_CANSA